MITGRGRGTQVEGIVDARSKSQWSHTGVETDPNGLAPSEPVSDETKTSALDTQCGGEHYKKFGAYQPWEVLHKWLTPEEFKGAMKKEVITYLAREADKGGRLDIEKAAHTLQIYLELTREETKS